MKLKRIRAIARKEIIQIYRDPLSMAMAFLLPVALIFIFGYAITFDVNNISTIVYDMDKSPQSRELVRELTASGYFTIVGYAKDYDDIDRYINSSIANVAISIPNDFSRKLISGSRPRLQVIVDGSDSNTATIALAYVSRVVAGYGNGYGNIYGGGAGGIGAEPALSQDLNSAGNVSNAYDPSSVDNAAYPSSVSAVSTTGIHGLDLRMRVWFNPELKSRYYIIPGLIAVIMVIIAALLTSLTVAREWERGTMELLISTPVKTPELIIGKLIPYFAIGFVDMLLSVAMGTLVFGVPLKGSFALIM
ncbi:MAG: ABC transporter permease, partial [Nitrospirae bacterium]|nr:ABC transporter permease [Nitrospirota bacterium]